MNDMPAGFILPLHAWCNGYFSIGSAKPPQLRHSPVGVAAHQLRILDWSRLLGHTADLGSLAYISVSFPAQVWGGKNSGRGKNVNVLKISQTPDAIKDPHF